MTLGTLLVIIGIVALAITLLIGLGFKKHSNWIMTFLQNFCGVLFIFSGLVKAVDPWGTAFKMQQYFAEFEAVFEPTWFSFLAPVFPWLSGHSLWFSIFMIIFEIVLGVMLLIGSQTKLTSWAFLLLVAFFTVLTGFTFLTGYVPPGENFFQFSTWTSYNENYMRVTDCGCFGDFIKLEPRISFYKDIFLLIPAVIFVFRHNDMHKLFTANTRGILVTISMVGLLVYCIKNSIWNIPSTDFRPFKENVNVRQTKAEEEEAEANIEILAWKLKNKNDGQIVELSNAVYMKEWKSYPKEEWEVVDQIQSEPLIEKTKISDFHLYDANDEDITEEFLGEPGYHFLLVVDHLIYKGSEIELTTIPDTTMIVDTIFSGDPSQPLIETMTFDTVFQVFDREEERVKYGWKPKYLERYRKALVHFAELSNHDDVPVRIAVGGASGEMAKQFTEELGLDAEVLIADDILLKTIIRSNPGITLWHDGSIIKKWHFSKLPSYEAVKENFMYE